MKYDKDDLIRKPMVRTIILGISLMFMIIGSKHIAYNGLNWSGGTVAIFGLLLIAMLHYSYENLLKETQSD